MRPQVVRVGPLAAASANTVAQSQTGTANTALVLNGASATGGVATLDMPRRIGITSVGNDSGNSFTIKGTNWSGAPVTELLVGGNASSVQSVLDYATVTSVTPTNATAAAVTVGTTATASSQWARLDEEGIPQTSIQATVSGTVTATLQQTLDDPNSVTNSVAPASMTWLPSQDANAVNFTANFQSNYAFAPIFARVTLTAGTGFVIVTYAQTGSASPS